MDGCQSCIAIAVGFKWDTAGLEFAIDVTYLPLLLLQSYLFAHCKLWASEAGGAAAAVAARAQAGAEALGTGGAGAGARAAALLQPEAEACKVSCSSSAAQALRPLRTVSAAIRGFEAEAAAAGAADSNAPSSVHVPTGRPAAGAADSLAPSRKHVPTGTAGAAAAAGITAKVAAADERGGAAMAEATAEVVAAGPQAPASPAALAAAARAAPGEPTVDSPAAAALLTSQGFVLLDEQQAKALGLTSDDMQALQGLQFVPSGASTSPNDADLHSQVWVKELKQAPKVRGGHHSSHVSSEGRDQ